MDEKFMFRFVLNHRCFIILKQNESLRLGNNKTLFISKNGWTIKSYSHPCICFKSKTIYIRGNDKKEDFSPANFEEGNKRIILKVLTEWVDSLGKILFVEEGNIYRAAKPYC
jgi:hypothetical protein